MAVSFNITGFKELERKLHNLEDKVQKTIVRSALRKEATKARGRIVENIDRIGLVKTGTMREAFNKAKIKSAANKGLIRLGPELPTREELGIDPRDKYYYPYAVEFGHDGAPPHPFIRPAIDSHRDKSIADIAADIGAGIEKEALK